MTVRAVLRRTVGAQWPILAGANFWRRGALLVGIGVGVAAVLRLVLSEGRAGLLVVRSKGIDFVTTVTVAAAIVYIASTIGPVGDRLEPGTFRLLQWCHCGPNLARLTTVRQS